MKTYEQVKIESQPGIILAGTLAFPRSASLSPAIVAVHGASDGTRDSPLLEHLQSTLPEQGITTLIFDRRGEGDSSGDPLSASIEDLANDVRACVKYVRECTAVDPARVGLWSHSQGGWIAPIVAAEDPQLAVLVAVSPAGMPPAKQMAYATRNVLHEAGYPETVITRVAMIRRAIEQYLHRNAGFEETQGLVDEVRNEPWFEVTFLPENLPHATHPHAEVSRHELDFDVRPALRKIKLPVLLIFGHRDRWVPIEESNAIWRSALNPAVDLSVVSIPNTGHYPTLGTDLRDWREQGQVSPEYESILTSWLQQHLIRSMP